jgi:hypothetical protein
MNRIDSTNVYHYYHYMCTFLYLFYKISYQYPSFLHFIRTIGPKQNKIITTVGKGKITTQSNRSRSIEFKKKNKNKTNSNLF